MPKGDADNLRADIDDGFAKVSNLLLEALCCAPLTGSEYAVVLFIMRRTYGWAKNGDRDSGLADTMTARQIATGTHQSNRTVEGALASLQRSHVILREQVNSSGFCRYGMNPEVSEWGTTAPEWKEAKVVLREGRETGAYTPESVQVYAHERKGIRQEAGRSTLQGVQVGAFSPTGTGPEGTPTKTLTESLTESSNREGGTAPLDGAENGAGQQQTAPPAKPGRLSEDAHCQAGNHPELIGAAQAYFRQGNPRLLQPPAVQEWALKLAAGLSLPGEAVTVAQVVASLSGEPGAPSGPTATEVKFPDGYLKRLSKDVSKAQAKQADGRQITPEQARLEAEFGQVFTVRPKEGNPYETDPWDELFGWWCKPEAERTEVEQRRLTRCIREAEEGRARHQQREAGGVMPQ